ncbi:MAG: hypothetical protein H6727_02710 [Myxococcales bacterium]|nr:hypothetical protein [Myxococcales bacterium]
MRNHFPTRKRFPFPTSRCLPWQIAVMGFLFFFSQAPSARAQNLLDLLTGGKSSDGKSLRLQSPEDIEVEAIQARQKEINQRYLDLQKQQASRLESIARDLRELRADTEQNRKARDQAIVRMDIDEGVLRAQMMRLYEEQHALLRTLESAYSSRSQSLLNLRDTMRTQLMARKKLKAWLAKQFGPRRCGQAPTSPPQDGLAHQQNRRGLQTKQPTAYQAQSGT